MSFLYENFDTLTKFGAIPNKHFPHIEDNLSPRFPIREYQKKAFSRFDYFIKSDFDGKSVAPFHLLYNMATGSGKTLVMAGLMLYLYEKGYRNFLFFVHSTNIVRKTKDNFLNSSSSKYLFNQKIMIDGQEIYVKETETFDTADDRNINIKFTTIQQLHLDLNNTKENSVTYEDFQANKMVIIADEAHHLSSATRNNGELFGSWEGTVLEILQQNRDNLLLEFTATLDYTSKEIASKYQDKVIFKYDLSQFRIDKFSKEINLIRSQYDEKERILQALILNLYRQELASKYNINLKPVILFKAKKTIKESEQNKLHFHHIIEELAPETIENIRETSAIPIVQKAFVFFDSFQINAHGIVERLKSNFKVENCLSANNDDDVELNQIRLNTLEDENNPIRAIFAVQKLNEGWDVLNLFDIVRLYEGQNTGGSNVKVGATTLSEAQLIGRGARYFPFSLEEGQDKFTRKYDNDISNDLKVLEELYYHTKEDNRYISELKKALVETGIYEDENNLVSKTLKLKEEFKKTDFYQRGQVVFNKKIEKSFTNIKSFSDLGVSKTNFTHILSSGFGKMTSAFFELEQSYEAEEKTQVDVPLTEIPVHVIRFALSQNPFFYFDHISHYFPNIESIVNFIQSKDYLGGLNITFSGTRSRISALNNEDYLQALKSVLKAIEAEIKSNSVEYEGSDYLSDYIHRVFPSEKIIRFQKDQEREEGQESMLLNEPWYVYNANYGTSEERAFVSMFARKFVSLEQKFTNIFLIRNERELKITDKFGRTFEPDFILFCKQKDNKSKTEKELTYQVFIEPKGTHLVPLDKWKDDFLREIRAEQKTIKIDTDHYLITGIPFFNSSNENETIQLLESTLV